MFHRYVASVLFDVAKVDWDNIAHVAIVFQVYVPNVHMFSDVCCNCVYSDVAKVDLDVSYICMLQLYVSSISSVSYVYCKYFIWMLYMFCNGYTYIFLMFQTYVASVPTISDISCKYFI
jgi:hypothetical protein